MVDKKEIGRKRIYNSYFKKKGRDDVVMWDILDVTDGEEIQLVFESINSTWRQGVWLSTDKGITINNELCPSADLWMDNSPKEVICICHTKSGFLSVYNIWDENDGYGRQSQAYTSGMLIEELPNGRRYHCNDFGFEPKFDNINFRIERI